MVFPDSIARLYKTNGVSTEMRNLVDENAINIQGIKLKRDLNSNFYISLWFIK
jgi:hypothetical protein